MGVFRDTNLSDRDLNYLNALWRQYSNPGRQDCVSVVLQNLWSTYGFTFGDETLLYSILAWQSSFNLRYTSSRDRVGDHLRYKKRFHQALIKSAQENTASEPHFFGALFAVLSGFHEIRDEDAVLTTRKFNGENGELRTFQLIMLLILKKLNEMEAFEQEPGSRKLQFLYNYVLSLVRLWASESATAAINYDMHIVSEKIPMPKGQVNDKRATYALPAQYFLRLGLTPDWQGIEWSLSDDIRALFSCFQKMLTLNRDEQAEDSPANELLKTSLKVLRAKVLKMQELPAIQNVLQRVVFLTTYGLTSDTRSHGTYSASCLHERSILHLFPCFYVPYPGAYFNHAIRAFWVHPQPSTGSSQTSLPGRIQLLSA
jgi:hypothetical protein